MTTKRYVPKYSVYQQELDTKDVTKLVQAIREYDPKRGMTLEEIRARDQRLAINCLRIFVILAVIVFSVMCYMVVTL